MSVRTRHYIQLINASYVVRDRATPLNDRFRSRIYGAYVRGRLEAMAPESIEGLRSRAPYLRKLVRKYFPADKAAQILFPAHWDPKLRIPRGQVVAAASIVSPKY